MTDIFTNSFSHDVFKQKYSMDGKETWAQTADRVVEAVAGPIYSEAKRAQMKQAIYDRKFIPAGRYLYSAGRPFHQVNNCLAPDTRFVTREGIRTLQDMAGQEVQILNRYGHWEDGRVESFGIQPLLRVDMGQGDVIYATPGHRWFVVKGGTERVVTTADLKTGDRIPLSFAAEPVEPDPEGIRHGIVYGDGSLEGRDKAYSRFTPCTPEKAELVRYWDDLTVTTRLGTRPATVATEQHQGVRVTGQPAHYKTMPDPEACTPEYARGFIAGLIVTDGSTVTGTSARIGLKGNTDIKRLRDLAVLAGCRVYSTRTLHNTTGYGASKAEPIEQVQLNMDLETVPLIRSDQIADRKVKQRRQTTRGVVSVGPSDVHSGPVEVFCVTGTASQSFSLAMGIGLLNCFLFRAEDSREGWADLAQKSISALMTGGGIGVDYSAIRPLGYPVGRTGGEATGPLSVMHIINESGRHVMQGGQRRSAIWAGLSWYHPDVFRFLAIKNWSPELRTLKAHDFTFPAPMELTNVSVIYDDLFYALINQTMSEEHVLAKLVKRVPWIAKDILHYWRWATSYGGGLRGMAVKVWDQNVAQGMKTGEPGWSFNVKDHRESLRNACTEVVSADDSDKCNLGTVWMQAHSSVADFRETVILATEFLMAGAIYSDLPTAKIREVGDRNNRIGVGLGGMAEWLMMRGEGYEVTPEMHRWLAEYRSASDYAAGITADRLQVAMPKGIRSIAPTGTIGIIAETTTGIEPLFCAAYLRRYYKDGRWLHQYVVDASVKRLMAKGIDVSQVFDSYDLTMEQRVRFQADVQDYVDMSISSTVNLPAWGSDRNNETTLAKDSRTLLEYGPRLRGLTVYPDGARGGQPLTKVGLEVALQNEGTVYEAHEDECIGGVCGI